ncbi:hypothetical protein FGO68_gene16913 [Halteria grandinella]|uniref:Uncharacterized protein n=1 Tax=Halteria grandinella TaxID=5974 RepID=A0A8J8SZN9_HALGN|nr:hypothetical protein FGO68_gene16913 [Halteria grandinella]
MKGDLLMWQNEQRIQHIKREVNDRGGRIHAKCYRSPFAKSLQSNKFHSQSITLSLLHPSASKHHHPGAIYSKCIPSCTRGLHGVLGRVVAGWMAAAIGIQWGKVAKGISNGQKAQKCFKSFRKGDELINALSGDDKYKGFSKPLLNSKL